MAKEQNKKVVNASTENANFDIEADELNELANDISNEIETILEETSAAADEQPDEVSDEASYEIVEETPHAKTHAKTKGIVSGCSVLRIRQAPNLKSPELSRIPENTKVKIRMNESTENFYSVSVNGINGFCVKTFIEII